MKKLVIIVGIGAAMAGIAYWWQKRQPQISDILTPIPEGSELDESNPIDSASPVAAQPSVASGSNLAPTENAGMSPLVVNDLIPTKSDSVVSSPGATPKTVTDGLAGTSGELNPPAAVKSIATAIKIAAITPIKPGSGFIGPSSAVTTAKPVVRTVFKPAIQAVSRPAIKPKPVPVAAKPISKPVSKPVIGRAAITLQKQKMIAVDGFDYLESEFNR